MRNKNPPKAVLGASEGILFLTRNKTMKAAVNLLTVQECRASGALLRQKTKQTSKNAIGELKSQYLLVQKGGRRICVAPQFVKRPCFYQIPCDF